MPKLCAFENIYLSAVGFFSVQGSHERFLSRYCLGLLPDVDAALACEKLWLKLRLEGALGTES